MTARFIVADVFDGLATLEDGSVDLVVTSPPFLALRSYLPADHPDKGKEIGSEPTPAAFIDVMLAVTAELRRVLAPHGSICVELGDTYAGSGGAGGDYGAQGLRDGQPKFDGSGRRVRSADVAAGILSPTKRPGPGQRDNIHGWPLAKSKTLIPELYRIALAYGRNPLRSPLTAREMVDWFERIVEDMRASGHEPPAADLLRMMNDYIDQRSEFGPYREHERWRVRNNVTWCRPNPPVGALGDKWRPATSDVVIACISDKRYWDDIATRRTPDSVKDQRYRTTNGPKQGADPTEVLAANYSSRVPSSPSGPPLLDYWEIPPGGYKGSHYAVFPPALVEPLVKAMAPPKVCRTCGEPSRRIVGEASYVNHRTGEATDNLHFRKGERKAENTNQWGATGQDNGVIRQVETLGWTDCGHDDYRPAHILDPFAGSGTTGVVATGHGHDVTLIDLDERNRELARERIGPFLFDEVDASSGP